MTEKTTSSANTRPFELHETVAIMDGKLLASTHPVYAVGVRWVSVAGYQFDRLTGKPELKDLQYHIERVTNWHLKEMRRRVVEDAKKKISKAVIGLNGFADAEFAEIETLIAELKTTAREPRW